MVAHAMGARLGVRVRADLMARTRRTATQTKLSVEERARNVAGAFEVRNPGSMRGQEILLVDDVLTTGATVNACAEALLSAGARRVCLAVLAHPFMDAR